MITARQEQTVHEWTVEYFNGAELSDICRVERAVTIWEAMAASPKEGGQVSTLGRTNSFAMFWKIPYQRRKP